MPDFLGFQILLFWIRKLSLMASKSGERAKMVARYEECLKMLNVRGVKSSTVEINHGLMVQFKEKIASPKRNECKLNAATHMGAGETGAQW